MKPKGSEMDYDGQEALRLLACNVLHVLTTTVSKIEEVPCSFRSGMETGITGRLWIVREQSGRGTGGING